MKIKIKKNINNNKLIIIIIIIININNKKDVSTKNKIPPWPGLERKIFGLAGHGPNTSATEEVGDKRGNLL